MFYPPHTARDYAGCLLFAARLAWEARGQRRPEASLKLLVDNNCERITKLLDDPALAGNEALRDALCKSLMTVAILADQVSIDRAASRAVTSRVEAVEDRLFAHVPPLFR